MSSRGTTKRDVEQIHISREWKCIDFFRERMQTKTALVHD